MYHGDFRLGDTLDIKFTTVSTAGAPTTLAGTPVVSAYPGNSTTQLTAGITLSVDFDGVTGLHNVRVVASSGNGYATATNYTLVITTGTVGGGSVVGYCIGSFSIENRSALMPTTAARTLDVSAGGEGGVDWANVGSPTTTVGLSGTTISSTQAVNVAQISGDSTAADNCEAFFDGNGYAGGTTPLSVNVIQWRGTQPTTLVSNRVDVSVGAMAADTLTATAIAADAFTAAKFASDVGTEFATAVGALVVETEGSYTVKQTLSVTLAALAGETTGTTFLTPNGNATRIDATVASNERTAVTLTPSS